MGSLKSRTCSVCGPYRSAVPRIIRTTLEKVDWLNFDEPLERLTPLAASTPAAERMFGRKCVCAA